MTSFNTPSNPFAPVYPAYDFNRNPVRKSGSVLKTVLITLGAFVVAGVIGLCVLIVIGASMNNKFGKKIMVGAKDEIYFRDGITEQEARTVGQSLTKYGYLKDRGVSVALSKDGAQKVMAFVVQDGVWDQPTDVRKLEIIGRIVAPDFGGLPMKLRLLNDKGEIKKEIKLT